jgi:two-component system, NarL family, nitrate/nitrite response regulator NarL
MSASAETAPSQLRVAVSASGAMRSRLAALVVQSGHELVELSQSPDAMLTDCSANAAAAIPAVALGKMDGAIDQEFAGLLPPEATAAQLDAALRAVAAGLTVRASRRQSREFGPLPEEPPTLLTPREVEILIAIANGLSNKAAARDLGISPHTVKFHIESVFRKLGAATRAEAVAKGLRRQIVEF